MLKYQKRMVKQLLKTGVVKKATFELRIHSACALVNLGIAKFVDDLLMLKSREKAERWLNSFEG